MSAFQAEKWANRLILAMASGGIDVPPEAVRLGMSVIAAFGLSRALGAIPWPAAEPLLDEMMGCVKYLPDPSKPGLLRPPNADDDIEEVETIYLLRSEVFELHTGFSPAAAIRTLVAAARIEITSGTPTSQEQSAP
jgi:hypothetical protein